MSEEGEAGSGRGGGEARRQGGRDVRRQRQEEGRHGDRR
jgi:hypothetical protein